MGIQIVTKFSVGKSFDEGHSTDSAAEKEILEKQNTVKSNELPIQTLCEI